MPQLIKHIDAIARQKQRDVLFVVFGARAQGDIVLRLRLRGRCPATGDHRLAR